MPNFAKSIIKSNTYALQRATFITLSVMIVLLSTKLVFNFDMFEKLGFLLLGIVGAIFANSTGAGGGVVFVPVFAQLGFSESQSISTSFGIQCFGMTAGAITWCVYYFRVHQKPRENWVSFIHLVCISAAFSVIGLWSNYASEMVAPAALSQMFSVFSIFLGVSILATSFLLTSQTNRERPTLIDWLVLGTISYLGGVLTAWLSVGVGEIIAFYLISRRFDATMAVATAVVVSAITVWSAAPQHFSAGSVANWQVLAFAGPGAILGGVVARRLVGRLSARRLKIFFGVWLLIIGIAS